MYARGDFLKKPCRSVEEQQGPEHFASAECMTSNVAVLADDTQLRNPQDGAAEATETTIETSRHGMHERIFSEQFEIVPVDENRTGHCGFFANNLEDELDLPIPSRPAVSLRPPAVPPLHLEAARVPQSGGEPPSSPSPTLGSPSPSLTPRDSAFAVKEQDSARPLGNPDWTAVVSATGPAPYSGNAPSFSQAHPQQPSPLSDERADGNHDSFSAPARLMTDTAAKTQHTRTKFHAKASAAPTTG